MRSNCLIWALAEAHRLRKAGRGGPGDEIKFTLRSSRHRGGISHVGVLMDGIERSFKPSSPRLHAWWEPPILFAGQVVVGDEYKPIELPPLPKWKAAVGRVLIGIAATSGAWIAKTLAYG